MKKPVLVVIFLLSGSVLALAGCTRPGAEQVPTPSPSPPATVYPDLPPQRSVEHGGFSFIAPSVYRLEYYPGIVFVTDPDSYLFISLAGGYEDQPIDEAQAIHQTLYSMESDVDDMNSGEPVEVTVAGERGLAVSFQGVQDDELVEGQLLYVLLDNQQSFSMIGLGGRDTWLEKGADLFARLLAGLTFFEATPLTDGCPVSSDPSFGYTPENPIRVAGVVQDEPSPLADYYFDFLRTLDDNAVEYQLVDTYPVQNSLLDVYQIDLGDSSQTVMLYVDEYHAGQLMVPQGFSCQY